MKIDTWTAISLLLRFSCFVTAYTLWRMILEDQNLCIPGEEMSRELKIFFLTTSILTAAAGATLGF